ncbi:MAG TPA: UdgX family uracil-DNA binding protein [Opitutaceae bacterium]|nr:UdgX family uracil-DNA binding protein [Opitutaceae bacterium]
MAAMLKGTGAAPRIPPRPTLVSLREAAAKCRACPLWRTATQTVFGEGPAKARVVFVGEQPGDREDVGGRPFVGPAGRLLDEALVAAGITREEVYVTNAVKHFKWAPAGKRRLHHKPNAREIAACRPWLEAELAVLRPEVVVALGATAAQDLRGAAFRVTRERGKVFRDVTWAGAFLATIHPSAILRMAAADRAAALAEFIADLKIAARLLR